MLRVAKKLVVTKKSYTHTEKMTSKISVPVAAVKRLRRPEAVGAILRFLVSPAATLTKCSSGTRYGLSHMFVHSVYKFKNMNQSLQMLQKC